MTSLTSLAAQEAEHGAELPIPPIAFGLIAFACFLILLAFVWSFRNTAADHRPQQASPQREHGRHRQQGTHGQDEGH